MAVAPAYVSQIPGKVAYTHVTSHKEVYTLGTVGPADTYVTGGFTITAASLGLSSIWYIAPVTFSTGHVGVYLPTNGTTGVLKVYTTAATELANASAALQNATFLVLAAGK